jgi:hypothetical protein
VSSSEVIYRVRPDATPGAEISALANVYRFILNSAQKRGRLLDKSGPDNPERRSDEIRAKTSIP